MYHLRRSQGIAFTLYAADYFVHNKPLSLTFFAQLTAAPKHCLNFLPNTCILPQYVQYVNGIFSRKMYAYFITGMTAL